MTVQETMSQFQLNLEAHGDRLSDDKVLINGFRSSVGELNELLEIPGDISDGLDLFLKVIDFPDATVKLLSVAPYVGAAVKAADTASKEVTKVVEPVQKGFEAMDRALTPVMSTLDNVSRASFVIETGLSVAESRTEKMQTIAEYMAEGTSDALELGAGLGKRIALHEDALQDFAEFHEDAAGLVDDLKDAVDDITEALTSFPKEALDNAMGVVDTVFTPVADAFERIENALCTKITVIPAIPAVTIPNPFGKPIVITPAIPAVRVSICDVIDKLDQQVQLVKNFVFDTIKAVLSKIGINLDDAVDGLKDALLEPLDGLIDAYENVADFIQDQIDALSDALNAVKDFFAGLLDKLAKLPPAMFDHEQMGDEGDNFLMGKTAPKLLAEGSDPEDDYEDAIFGLDGNDVVLGLGGNDFLFGGKGKDEIHGDEGDDEAYGGLGKDMLFGEDGHDHLDGGKGKDDLKGGAGQDRIIGGHGRDEMTGGEDADTFVLTKKSGRDTITDFEIGIDRIEIQSGAESFEDLTLTQKGGDVMVKFANVKLRLNDFDVSDLGVEAFVFA